MDAQHMNGIAHSRWTSGEWRKMFSRIATAQDEGVLGGIEVHTGPAFNRLDFYRPENLHILAGSIYRDDRGTALIYSTDLDQPEAFCDALRKILH